MCVGVTKCHYLQISLWVCGYKQMSKRRKRKETRFVHTNYKKHLQGVMSIAAWNPWEVRVEKGSAHGPQAWGTPSYPFQGIIVLHPSSECKPLIGEYLLLFSLKLLLSAHNITQLRVSRVSAHVSMTRSLIGKWDTSQSKTNHRQYLSV